MIDLVRKHQQEIAALCKQFKVRQLEIFGSCVTGEFDPDSSDLDFIVDFDAPEAPPGLLSRYLALAEALERLLGKPVDLITQPSIKNPYFRKAVDDTREPVYAA
jgi:hypothetical protein